ncbi:MAG: protoporphyrinogen oxidase [Ornithinimicrobium sp.]
MRSHCVIVGAGISGLAAAWHLRSRYPQVQVTVVDSSDRVGGKIAADAIGELQRIDTGAESVLARRPEAIDLIDKVGLGPDMVHPATSTASIWSRGSLRQMPPRTLLGIPSDPQTLQGLLTAAEIERVRHEEMSGEGTSARVAAGAAAPAPADENEDISIGDLVAGRLGDAVVDRLVEPLLGGVYAGHARSISAAAALPVAFNAYRTGESLIDAAARTMPALAAGLSPPPVFAGIRGGLHRLPAALAARLRERGVAVRLGVTVRSVRRDGSGFALDCGPVPSPETIDADLVVLATPAPPTGRILERIAPDAARILAGVEMASMAIVSLALPSSRLGELPGSGVLVPPVEGLSVKAATFSSNKWEWVARAGAERGPAGEERTYVRASIGRHHETHVLRGADRDLIQIVLEDLRQMGLALPEPVAWQVKRWGGALPQYALGHRAKATEIVSSVRALPGLAVCGATYEGVGIPACIASGRAAAEQVAASQ